MSRLSIPTTARLPSSLRVDPSNIVVIKSLNRLSRESLLALALDWLDEGTVANATPYLDRRGPDEEPDGDDLYPPCRTVAELQQLYADMQEQRGSKRDVVSRVLEGDWRHGLTLYQLAMVDFAYLDEHPASQKWTAYKILPLAHPSHDADTDEALKVDDASLEIPRFHPSTFLQNLQDQVLPDVKAHYHFYRPSDYPVLLLRVFAIDSPYNSQLALSAAGSSAGDGAATNYTSSRTVYLAFPDGSPNLYISKSQSAGASAHGESRSLQSLIVKGVPKALSRPRQRFALKNTGLTSRNLDALLDRRGPGRGNAAAGGWSIYANDKNKKSPLDPLLPQAPLSAASEHSRKRASPLTQQRREAKRARLVAKGRFGDSAIMADGKGVERLDVIIRDPYPSVNGVDVPDSGDEGNDGAAATAGARRGRRRSLDTMLDEDGEDVNASNGGAGSRWTPNVRVTFQGTHVFAGIRQLVEAGIVDGERMPGWMTGEEGVTAGVVRHGRIKGNKGSGI
ncbi:CHL4-like protein [Cordyceps fumosorosea ARSEF 2679]|uniref:CHL4-like protein n=1 Tax=Cordyceps fumosorosea (strain ARSEF 2679) TaxID=1081104 RepID=A0A168B6Z4_CORFA|nr:CHL4-like protein [Cordyceps fumosorosea ARSEF 2679]OAA69708.1 CHL4-like protein [Cordyceps fumosorosea ARSEF 2679]